MTEMPIALMWFRQDLRLADNPALAKAASFGVPILPLYILDDETSGAWKMGGASRWWLHQSLASLSESLERSFGVPLCLARGPAQSVLEGLIAARPVKAVVWNRCYEPWRIQRDAAIKEAMSQQGIDAVSCNGSLLFEPHTALKEDGTPYKVFTPFYRRGCLAKAPPRLPLPKPKDITFAASSGLALEELNLLPSLSWSDEMETLWQPGEVGAEKRLQTFLKDGILGYKKGRDYPARKAVSRLSPHLHYGEISPHKVWYEAQAVRTALDCDADIDHFLSELGWREFSHSLLYHYPDLPTRGLQSKFDVFPWRDDPAALKRWQRGQTGFPIVDAGMRELWRTGYLHNRLRMIVGSFLVKNLLIHWQHGERWFWDTLLDADLANNSSGWQWIAGCGADAAPYFRIFNPVTQGQKFDGAGEYVRKYIPELRGLPDTYIHAPWEAPENILQAAKVRLGETYPERIVDLKSSRNRALSAFGSVSGKAVEPPFI